jgi:hypothetical protein
MYEEHSRKNATDLRNSPVLSADEGCIVSKKT